MEYRIRQFRAADGPSVNRLALRAFAEYKDAYDDWPAFARRIGDMVGHADSGELLVAEGPSGLIGAILYVPPDAVKAGFFPEDWAVLRLLVVDPEARGHGVGRSLTEACLEYASRDGASTVGLHTSPIMAAAVRLYEALGFRFQAPAPAIHGVPYGIYAKDMG